MKTHYTFGTGGWDPSPEELFADGKNSPSEHARGRARVVFFTRNGIDFVRKHYARGGFVRRFISDHYAYPGLNRTRMWREFQLLEVLRALELPVPEPVAARCVRHSALTYSGDLVTVRLREAETLGTILRKNALSKDTWKRLGAILALFHHHSVYHADLNIENILLGPQSQIHLLDFDKGSIRPRGRKFWIKHNLDRLLRSLEKARTRSKTFHFSPDDWQALVEQHKTALAEPWERRSDRV